MNFFSAFTLGALVVVAGHAHYGHHRSPDTISYTVVTKHDEHNQHDHDYGYYGDNGHYCDHSEHHTNHHAHGYEAHQHNHQVEHHAFNGHDHHNQEHYEHYDHEHKQHDHAMYKYKYGVKDPKTGDVKQQWEYRDGDTVKGGYAFKEADGTIRLVKYTSDKKNGFQASVHTIGHAHKDHKRHHGYY